MVEGGRDATRWWRSAQQQAERLGVKVGSTITFAAQDAQINATVVALTKADGQHAYSRAEFMLPQACAEGAAGGLVWRRACGPEAGGGVAAGAVSGVSRR